MIDHRQDGTRMDSERSGKPASAGFCFSGPAYATGWAQSVPRFRYLGATPPRLVWPRSGAQDASRVNGRPRAPGGVRNDLREPTKTASAGIEFGRSVCRPEP